MEKRYANNNEKSAPDLWNALPGNSGEYFSLHDQYIAGAQANRLTVWRNENRVFEGYAPVSCDGYPRWKEDAVFWNDSCIDLRVGQQLPLGILQGIVLGARERNAHPIKPEAKRPITFAWSPDAEHFLYTVEDNSDTPGSKAQALLSRKDGSDEKLLWDGSDFAPRSACIGETCMVLGTRNPMIFDREGKLLKILPGELFAKRIHLSQDGMVLFVQTHESVRLWHTQTWLLKTEIRGPWLNAAWSPDGEMLYAVDFEGNLYVAGLQDERRPLKKIPIPDPLTTIDAGEAWLVAGFAKGDAVRRASRKAIDSLLTGAAV